MLLNRKCGRMRACSARTRARASSSTLRRHSCVRRSSAARAPRRSAAMARFGSRNDQCALGKEAGCDAESRGPQAAKPVDAFRHDRHRAHDHARVPTASDACSDSAGERRARQAQQRGAQQAGPQQEHRGRAPGRSRNSARDVLPRQREHDGQRARDQHDRQHRAAPRRNRAGRALRPSSGWRRCRRLRAHRRAWRVREQRRP